MQSADAATDWDLSFAELAPTTTAALAEALPSFATLTNPVDLTAALIGSVGVFSRVVRPLAADPSVDALHLALPIAGQGYELDVFADELAAIAVEQPVVVSCPMPDRVSSPFRDAGLPLFLTETEAIGALGSLLGQQARLAATRQRQPGFVPPVPVRGQMLDEAASMAWLASAGVPVVAHRLCSSAPEAVDAWHALGEGPVVLKGCSAEVSHKSELGIVRLGLRSEDDVRRAYADVAGRLAAADLPSSGVIVARMASGRRELLLGAHRDPVFGPVVLIGDGGTYVEASPDVRVLFPPFSVADAMNALRRLRVAPILEGIRGEPPADLASVARAAAALGERVDDIASVDVNPLFIGVEGEGCVAADAVVLIADPREGA